MAREMSLNTKKFGSTANYKREPWKSPIPVFIEVLYFKHFGKTKTDKLWPFLQMFRDEKQKRLAFNRKDG